MSRARVFQVITRMVQGGARQVVAHLLRGLPRDRFAQTLVYGIESVDEESLRAEVRAQGADLFRVPDLVRDIHPRRDLRALLHLATLFARRRPHLVHAHTYKAGVLGSLAARLAGVPAVVFTPHGHIFARGSHIPGVPLPGWKLGMLRRITQIAQTCPHRVTALSEDDLRDQLAMKLSPSSKYRVIRNGIDLDRFQGPPLRSGGPVIGSVGRFTSEKGHRYLMEAFARVRKRLPAARLVLVGFGELESDLRRRAEGSVAFPGERDSAEMLPAFDLFVQPSLYESQGLAIIEAMAAGRPVIATDVGGVRDVVQDGETGLLVPPADPAALAGAIVRLAEAPEFAASLAARAKERVRLLFSAERMVADYVRLYNELLGRYNSRPCSTI